MYFRYYRYHMMLLISIILIKIPMNIAVVFHMTHLSDACDAYLWNIPQVAPTNGKGYALWVCWNVR